jgi:hypothetical protein
LGSVLAELDREFVAGSTIGWQLFVSVDGEVVADVARSCGPLAHDRATPYNLYCALKPLWCFAVLSALEGCGVVLEDRVSSLLETSTADDGLCLHHLVAHDAGLGEPTALEYFWSNQAAKAELLASEKVLCRASAGGAAYSEVAAFSVLSEIAMRVTGRSGLDLVASAMQDLALDDTFGALSPPDWYRRRDYLGVYWDLDETPAVPLLHDRLPRFACSTDLFSIGGYSTAHDLGAWYNHVLAVLDGGSAPGIPRDFFCAELVKPLRRRVFDPVLGRPCSFGAGVMVELADHHFGPRPSPLAFGHSGFLGNSFAFADPAVGVVIAFVTSGIRLRSQTRVDVERPVLVHMVYDELGVA